MAMVHPPSRFSSRRSPLDSATYRTLVRIFSLCPKPSQQQIPNPSFDSAEEFKHGGTEKGAAIAADSLREPAGGTNPRASSPQLAVEESGDGKGFEEGRPCADGGIVKGEAFTNSSSAVEVLFDIEKELELDDECFEEELFRCIMTDCERLIDCPADNQEKAQIGSSGLEKEVRERAGQEIDADALVSKPTYELNCEKDANKEKSSECLKREAVEAAGIEENVNVRDRGDGTEQEACINSGPFVIDHVTEVSLEEGEMEVEVSEGGEIPNEGENSNQPVDLVHDGGDKELEEELASEGFNKYVNSVLTDCHPSTNEIHFKNRSIISYEGLTEFDNDGSFKSEKKRRCGYAFGADSECKASVTEVVEGHIKRAPLTEGRKAKKKVVEGRVKRAPATEERKARKKIANKRKRAQKEREQGVKRLKIQPVIKPKVVQVCRFYSHGKCQQGDKCKFSHDTTPLTKSTPCKHFVYDSCLKGDDCPFDHQLSNYLCHNFRDTGFCDRGDGCKFSHKVTVPEDTSPAAASKADAVPSSCKSNVVKLMQANRTSLRATGQPKRVPAPSSQFSMDKPAAGKGAMPMPNGIRFVSVGKGPSGNADKQKIDQQKKEKPMGAAQKIVSFPGLKPLPSAPNACNTSSSGVLQTEVSEASKLLEEFLFCGFS